MTSIDPECLGSLELFFKVFGERTRLEILFLLEEGKRNVGEIADALERQPSAISHQLRMLRQLRLVKGEKVGKEVYYSLADDHIQTILRVGLSHVGERSER